MRANFRHPIFSKSASHHEVGNPPGSGYNGLETLSLYEMSGNLKNRSNFPNFCAAILDAISRGGVLLDRENPLLCKLWCGRSALQLPNLRKIDSAFISPSQSGFGTPPECLATFTLSKTRTSFRSLPCTANPAYL